MTKEASTILYSPEYGQPIEHAIIRGLLAEMDKSDFIPVFVFDGAEYMKVASEQEVLDAIFSVEESTLHFAPRGNPDQWGCKGIFLVCGNGPDLISDYSGSEPFAAAVGRTLDRIVPRFEAAA